MAEQGRLGTAQRRPSSVVAAKSALDSREPGTAPEERSPFERSMSELRRPAVVPRQTGGPTGRRSVVAVAQRRVRSRNSGEAHGWRMPVRSRMKQTALPRTWWLRGQGASPSPSLDFGLAPGYDSGGDSLSWTPSSESAPRWTVRSANAWSRASVATSAPSGCTVARRLAARHARLGQLHITRGRHIVFADGRFAPVSIAGQRLLAHELAHVVQQDGRASQSAPQLNALATQFQDEPTLDAISDGKKVLKPGDKRRSGHPCDHGAKRGWALPSSRPSTENFKITPVTTAVSSYQAAKGL